MGEESWRKGLECREVMETVQGLVECPGLAREGFGQTSGLGLLNGWCGVLEHWIGESVPVGPTVWAVTLVLLGWSTILNGRKGSPRNHSLRISMQIEISESTCAQKSKNLICSTTDAKFCNSRNDRPTHCR
jgi:hypothetical protein